MGVEDFGAAWWRLDERLWGKELGLPGPYPVICHLLDVGAVFGVLWDVLLYPRLRERIANALDRVKGATDHGFYPAQGPAPVLPVCAADPLASSLSNCTNCFSLSPGSVRGPATARIADRPRPTRDAIAAPIGH
ncbi:MULTISPECIES: HD domain-containing protein [Streptomyces]|uniref:HD domain-containing protein n=1 Tax=Streptomyces ramulosus TaxID=47762 RepID=A0ABW1FW31_9ACTN